MNILRCTLIICSALNLVQSFRQTVDLIATRSGLINKMQLQSMFPLKDIVEPSLELALTNCQEIFKWDRWNCPSTDFLSKRTAKHLDRESAFVVALTTAALLYSITKKCSSGGISGCGCVEDKNNEFAACSDDPEYAEQVIGRILRQDDSLDVQAYALLHNTKAAKLVIRKSLRRHCPCEDKFEPYSEDKCWHSLRPFADIAKDMRQMYDNALVVNAHNSGVVNWKHLPVDGLVFVQDSPNYCDIDAIPGWSGIRGRQCYRTKGKDVSQLERLSCRNLCRSCGLRVRGQTVVAKKRCNCKFSWCCQVQCDVCVSVEKQHYCD